TSVIRSLGYQHPIVALTAAMAKDIRQQLAGLGFNDVLSKPITKHHLYRTLRSYLTGPAVTALNAQPAEKKLHFLVVEDDAEAAQLMQILLENLGVTATLAQSAEECMQLLALHHHFDRILLDMGLPDCNGLQLVERIEHNYPENVVIIVSGHDYEPAVYTSALVQQSIANPFSKQALIIIVATCL